VEYMLPKNWESIAKENKIEQVRKELVDKPIPKDHLLLKDQQILRALLDSRCSVRSTVPKLKKFYKFFEDNKMGFKMRKSRKMNYAGLPHKKWECLSVRTQDVMLPNNVMVNFIYMADTDMDALADNMSDKKKIEKSKKYMQWVFAKGYDDIMRMSEQTKTLIGTYTIIDLSGATLKHLAYIGTIMKAVQHLPEPGFHEHQVSRKSFMLGASKTTAKLLNAIKPLLPTKLKKPMHIYTEFLPKEFTDHLPIEAFPDHFREKVKSMGLELPPKAEKA